MYFCREEVKTALLSWCEEFQVDVREVVLFGSAGLMFHGLVDAANDIDIEIPQREIQRLLPHGATSPIPNSPHLSTRYIGHGIEHANVDTKKPSVFIDGLHVCTLERFYSDYQSYNRPKDAIKLRRIQAALAVESMQCLIRNKKNFSHQEKFGKSDNPPGERGNCAQVCLAALLDLPISSVPDFYNTEESPEQQDASMQRWLSDRGWIRVWIPWEWFTSSWIDLPPSSLVMICGKSPRGDWQHAVVGKINSGGWELVHDPHPSSNGLDGIPTGVSLITRSPVLGEEVSMTDSVKSHARFKLQRNDGSSSIVDISQDQFSDKDTYNEAFHWYLAQGYVEVPRASEE